MWLVTLFVEWYSFLTYLSTYLPTYPLHLLTYACEVVVLVVLVVMVVLVWCAIPILVKKLMQHGSYILKCLDP